MSAGSCDPMFIPAVKANDSQHSAAVVLLRALHNKYSELDDFDADVVRRIIHEFNESNEYPTAFSILNEIKKILAHYQGCVLSNELDDIACSMGHEIVRLSLIHCEYNPIELIRAQVKGKVAKNNSASKWWTSKDSLRDIGFGIKM
ncbi:Hypothetical protein CINCED_3A015673 [Cinara cedri]|uniref:Uncharacterized protein n=1 Tax=Cinara cedri TaxID=506608 RepID=A0A5E4MJJ5_9HEMI|nr:Hypothetical protein CINCED_3A015673 [Cinara cedri]